MDFLPRMANPEKVLPLTSLRFFAAVAIVFHHYFGLSFPAASQNRWILPVVGYSAVAVFFFFVLSGYILGYVYLRRGERVDHRRFYVSRLARIYPLYLVTIVVSVPGLLMARLPRMGLMKAGLGTAATFTAHALLLQHWVPQLGALNYPSWSISAETFFYAVFPTLGYFLWKRSTGGAMAIGATWFVASWGILVGGEQWPRYAIVPRVMPLFELNLFVIGIVLVKFHTALLQSQTGSRGLVRWGGVVAAVSVALFAAFTEWKASLPFARVHDAVAAVIFLLIILGFGSGNRMIEKVFTVKWLVVLGESSYGLYLIHAPFYELLMALHMRASHTFFVLYLGAAIGLSVLSFRYFETPARAAILRGLSTRPRETLAESSISQ